MQKLTEQFQHLLGFPDTWKGDDVNLSKRQRARVASVSLNMWQPFTTVINKLLPKAAKNHPHEI
jgi:hypothetical protein